MVKLGEILIRKNLISHGDLKQAMTIQSACYQQLGELLIQQGLIAESDLQQALQEQYWRRHGFWIID